MTKFGATFLPAGLSQQLKNSRLCSFAIQTPKFTFTTGSKNYRLILSGEPVISGWSGETLRSVTTTSGIAVGYDFANTNNKCESFGSDHEIEIVISKLSLPDVRLSKMGRLQVPVAKGVTLVATLGIETCNHPMCSFLKKTLVSSASFTLKSTIESASSFALFAAFL
eukprot:m.218472 g.218472  ORF g.218472 m.218472 type:complete len:167 (+) comp39898_c0_seq20:351-851(+)